MTPPPASPPRRLLPPLRYCTGAGCHARTREGRCPACRTKGEQQRGSAHQRGYGSRWARYAQQWKRDYPLCGMRADGALHDEHSQCVQRGLVTPAYAVDHIRPHDGPGDATFYHADNHQSLCRSCHSAKTAAQDGGFTGVTRERGTSISGASTPKTAPQPSSRGIDSQP